MARIAPSILGTLLGGVLGVLQIVIRNHNLFNHKSWLYGQLGDFAFFFFVFCLLGIFYQMNRVAGRIWLIFVTLILIYALWEESCSADPMKADDLFAYIAGTISGMILCIYPVLNPLKK